MGLIIFIYFFLLLQAALGDNNLSLIANGQLPSGPLDGVEDLSMKSQASHLENLSTEPIR